MNRATNGMMASVVKPMKIAGDYMSATSVEKQDIEAKSVEQPDFMPKRPKYLERSVWTDVETSPLFSPTACCTSGKKEIPKLVYIVYIALVALVDSPHFYSSY